MRVIKYIALALFLSVLIAAGLLLQLLLRFDLLLNEVVHEIRTDSSLEKWGDRAELIPDLFNENEKRENVELKLDRYGFTRVDKDDLWSRYHFEIDAGREVYLREGSDIVCIKYYYVFIGFTEDNLLNFAEGTVHEHGCL